MLIVHNVRMAQMLMVLNIHLHRKQHTHGANAHGTQSTPTIIPAIQFQPYQLLDSNISSISLLGAVLRRVDLRTG